MYQENIENTSKLIKSLLALKTAPQGDIKADFRVALYVVLAAYHLSLDNPRESRLITSLLPKVGYGGDLSKLKKKDYTQTIKDLVQKGALVEVLHEKIYVAPAHLNTIEAKVDVQIERIGPDKLFYYVIYDDKGIEYRLNSDLVLLPNDVIEAITIKNSTQAYALKIVKKRECILGRLQLFNAGRSAQLIPDEEKLAKYTFRFNSGKDLAGAQSGDVIIAKIVRRFSNNSFEVVTKEVVKDIGNLNNIIVMSVLRNDIPYVWPDNLLNTLKNIPEKVTEKEAKGRVDLRKLPLVTIDGEDARDFDDAVFCQKEGDGWRLYVSIADVSYYVKQNTLLDAEAMNRCNSCYFPNFVIPMLPEKLSNGICSLNPDVDRLCMTCEMVISKNGRIENYKFYPAIMKSHARLTYTEAWKMISEGECIYPEHQSVLKQVKELYNLYEAFKKYRIERGGISIESEELHFVFDENLEIQGVKPYDRNDAHKLIEECMIAANVAAACFVSETEYKTLYRVHAKPMEQKLDLLVNQLAKFGVTLKGGDKPTSKDYMHLAQSIEERADAKILNNLILRSMSKAEYSPDNIGHFGLALEKYAHFTSPIRRYADLQLHRVIKYILEKQEKRNWGKIGAKCYTKAQLVSLGVKCTNREIAAANAEREVDASLACVFMEKYIGQEVEGTITGCTRFGLFVNLDDFGVDGMIYIGSFDSYMNFDEQRQCLVSDRGMVYSLGKKIKVIVSDVNHEERKVLLQPVLKSNKNSKSKIAANGKKKLKIRQKIQENYPSKDKRELLEELSDISQSKPADSKDQVVRKFVYSPLKEDLPF